MCLAELFRDHAERGFRFLTVVTDSITVNAAFTWSSPKPAARPCRKPYHEESVAMGLGSASGKIQCCR